MECVYCAVRTECLFIYIYIYIWFLYGTEDQIQLKFFLTDNSVRLFRTKHSPVLFTVTAAVFSKRHMTPCAYSSYYLNVTQLSLWCQMSLHGTVWTFLPAETKQTEQTVQTLSQYPHSERTELASLFLTLSTAKISTPLLRATVAVSFNRTPAPRRFIYCSSWQCLHQQTGA